MKIQPTNQTNFNANYEKKYVYYELPSTFDKLPIGQIRAIHSLERKLSGSGLIGSFCPKVELLSNNGWNILASPSIKDNVIDVAMINNDKFIKKNEKNIFGTPRVNNELQYDAAIILGSFYDNDWLSNDDKAAVSKLRKTFPMDELINKIKEGLEFAKKNIAPKQKGIFKLI